VQAETPMDVPAADRVQRADLLGNYGYPGHVRLVHLRHLCTTVQSNDSRVSDQRIASPCGATHRVALRRHRSRARRHNNVATP
jgi:hypothetical protein